VAPDTRRWVGSQPHPGLSRGVPSLPSTLIHQTCGRARGLWPGLWRCHAECIGPSGSTQFRRGHRARAPRRATLPAPSPDREILSKDSLGLYATQHEPDFDDAHRGLPLEELLDLILQVKSGAYSIEAANPRHEHA
jgi:hypothetical protein